MDQNALLRRHNLPLRRPARPFRCAWMDAKTEQLLNITWGVWVGIAHDVIGRSGKRTVFPATVCHCLPLSDSRQSPLDVSTNRGGERFSRNRRANELTETEMRPLRWTST